MIHLFHKISEVNSFLSIQLLEKKTIGFVPTMGALHEGHLQLVKRAASENDIAVVSIFVNPIQFNNKEDLEKYPRNLEQDLNLLEKTGCSVVFAPTAEEMYPEPDTTEFDFGNIDKVMEGKFRPGHFRGVAIVVKKLFEIVQPTKAYFGEKDFQQLAVIKRMVAILNLEVEIIPCPIIRETDGLAMSSRNTRLTETERENAPAIYKSLVGVKDIYSWFTPDGLSKLLTTQIEQDGFFRVEYISVVDTVTLQTFEDWMDAEHAVVCVAAFIGKVRLIDNMILY